MSDAVLNIVIPMAGRGSRFVDAGYSVPKPLILVHGMPMIELVVRNLRTARPHRFVFLVLEDHLERYRLRSALDAVAQGCEVVTVSAVTQGAACTVLLADDLINNGDPLMIANSDQWVDVDIDEYLSVADAAASDGFIMTMIAHDPKWSFVEFAADGTVAGVVEKEPVSEEATVGIYNFRQGSQFVECARAMIAADARVKGEFYVAPVYNELIARGGTVELFNIGTVGQRMYGLGTPADLDAFLSLPMSVSAVRRRA